MGKHAKHRRRLKFTPAGDNTFYRYAYPFRGWATRDQWNAFVSAVGAGSHVAKEVLEHMHPDFVADFLATATDLYVREENRMPLEMTVWRFVVQRAINTTTSDGRRKRA